MEWGIRECIESDEDDGEKEVKMRTCSRSQTLLSSGEIFAAASSSS